MKPIFSELANEEQGYVFAAIEGDKNPAITAQYGVNAFPSFVVFKKGVQWGKIVGGKTKNEFLSEFKKIVGIEKPMNAFEAERLLELLTAISQSNLDQIKKTIALGVDINGILETPQGNFSPLSLAIMTGPEEIIKFLMSSGARMDAVVQEAVIKQIDMFVQMTETLQKNFNSIKNKIATFSSPVKQAVKITGSDLGIQFVQVMGNQEELKKLIDQGADVNIVFSWGKSQTTPICVAMLMNNTEAIDMLINAGASLSVEIIDGHGCKKSLEQGIKDDLEAYKQCAIKSRERLAYALNISTTTK